MRIRLVVGLSVVAFLSACGGGGGGSSSVAPQPTPATPPPLPAAPTRADLAAASQFAARATFGIPYEGIESIARQGIDVWLDKQLELPYTSHAAVAEELIRRRDADEFKEFENGVQFLIVFWRASWWRTVMTASDQVRQRTAFALSEIFVISDIDLIRDNPYGITTYVDVLLDGAFGNYRDLLKNVSLHPAMGIYLSHVNNRKSNPEENVFPDQNFAREVMQLFTIGLYELNIDGSLKLDSSGNPIPTYDNEDIYEMAKIWTGLSYGGGDARFGKYWPYYREPMQMYEEWHEPGEKRLLNGMVVPNGQTGMEDIEDAIDNLFHHPNVGPFIGKQLIQRLVTSNPSPAYIERVARTFNGDDTGVRGDMKAVLRAILLDPEATDPVNANAFGKLREPVVRLASLARQFKAKSEDGEYFNNGYRMQNMMAQHPFTSPSVFNFFSPFHSPAGTLAEHDLVAPEFQITTANTVIGVTNQIDLGIFDGNALFSYWEPFKPTRIDISEYVDMASNPPALMERLDLLLTFGQMDLSVKQTIIQKLRQIQDMEDRAKHAIYLTLLSPDYAVET